MADSTAGDTTGSTDRIEREILIDAAVDRVWQLVSTPGWWIGDEAASATEVSREGDLVVVDHPRHGRFWVRSVAVDAPHRVSFRSAVHPGPPPGESGNTLVEFVLTEQDGGTLLRVVESGFASMPVPEQDRITLVQGNIRGWERMLGVARQVGEHAG